MYFCLGSISWIICSCIRNIDDYSYVSVTVTATGQVYKQTVEFVYLGGVISADWDLRSIEVTRRIQRARAYFGRYKMKIYDRLSVRCAFTSEGADAESRGSRDATVRVCDVEFEQG